ncbi:MAG: putative integral membrane protein [candidate division WWE3 bacterium GW2011_GWA1_46_21]|uniref:Putative integral membrane protein n=1 Tax=candidate division WWE3 bacterium GW2011_GWA1_46_21 TaxID=1619107 RepID=A0A0G1PDB8_UNCKA|nr:MAG: putative integral membrane protein [candidate division WWE3 bacterium GW2011_GWA1_46_21]
MKNRKLLLKILVSLLLLAVIIWTQDTDKVFRNISGFNFIYALPVCLLLILNYIVSSVRWKALLIHQNSDKTPLKYLTSLYFIGAFFNNFLPTSIGGDGYKIYKLGQKINNTTDAFSATFMERFTGVMALTVISLASLISILGWFGLLLFFLFWIVAVFGFFVLKKISAMSFTNKHLSLLAQKTADVYRSLSQYASYKKELFWALITSFVVQLLAVFSQYFVFKGVGITLPIFYSLFAFPFIFLAGYAIPSLNGVGVQDALYVRLFGSIGVVSEIAVSASILYHLFRLGVSLIGGVLYAVGKAD